MYKLYCPKCKQYNYSASKTEETVCCHCGKSLVSDSKKAENKETEKLA